MTSGRAEHAFAQNARYGGQYGVPGYPPPPPVGAPGYDPLHTRSEAPTVAVGTEAPGDTAPPPRGTRPVTEAVGSTAEPGSGYRLKRRCKSGLGTGAHRAVPDPSTTAFRSDAATHRAGAGPRHGVFPPPDGHGVQSGRPGEARIGCSACTGLPSDTGSYGAVSSGLVAGGRSAWYRPTPTGSTPTPSPPSWTTSEKGDK